MSGKSKYFQVKEGIEGMILRGDFRPGDRLLSEPELVEQFRVSRGTVRKALKQLETDGVLSRRSGEGTFVISRPKTSGAISFTRQIAMAGLRPTTRVLAAKRIMASEAPRRVWEAYFLDEVRAKETAVYCIDRLRLGSEQPLARQTVYLLAAQFSDELLREEDFSKSLYDIYHKYNRQVGWADEIIRVRPTTEVEANLLAIATGTYAYIRNRISYDKDNRPLEVMQSADRIDFFQSYRYRIQGEGSVQMKET